jgi:hypothetical protein
MSRTVKIKKKKAESRSLYPQGYYPNGEWAGFFYDEDTAKAWCKKEKGRRYDFVPLPKIERVKQEVKKVTQKVVKGRGSAVGNKTAIRDSRRTVKTTAPAKEVNWNASDIEDEAKMEKVAKKSRDEAIKKLKGKK